MTCKCIKATALAICITFTVHSYRGIRPSIIVKCEAQHCSFVLQVLFGVKITFSILEIQNFPL